MNLGKNQNLQLHFYDSRNVLIWLKRAVLERAHQEHSKRPLTFDYRLILVSPRAVQSWGIFQKCQFFTFLLKNQIFPNFEQPWKTLELAYSQKSWVFQNALDVLCEGCQSNRQRLFYIWNVETDSGS